MTGSRQHAITKLVEALEAVLRAESSIYTAREDMEEEEKCVAAYALADVKAAEGNLWRCIAHLEDV